jgi:NOL1/NOP2/fmu family ribosome biogenesis protein
MADKKEWWLITYEAYGLGRYVGNDVKCFFPSDY